ncbi:MAG: Fe-S cluster assembly protein NifU [Nitrospirae bacterium GWC2_46_6]|nr:MAG: Fe-S cluster assembly protein NifU [Nitrospirae bacterium GWA2_46_11]OGW22573.1 MAG: Fe-S cluster assembly protein NifU [Nitrospirae bacterium GWC2_46_6]OGW23357.1 MAG: Fe-S cluster assembly protein NifU [Nitrospirae bacterium GWB2_47_37]HAK87783.1 Fe-S cluster assembly protein NifU [Nitrospiraceae bacterium]HCZ11844.1 Fe-S cluster assembly protein NifU [Nitrospiraceae bacterium]
MWEYTKKLKDLFLHPKNVGEIENPDAVGEVGSIICGDALRLTLKVDKETGRIIDAKFQTFGCASAIASSSALTEMIKGRTLDEAIEVTNQDIAEYLGGLPKEKMHCSVMGREALEAAIADYKGEIIPPEEKEKLVCQCFEVTEEKIRRVAIENHLTTVEEITDYTKAGGGCGSCIPRIEEILKDIWHIKMPEMPAVKKKLTNLQKIALIQDVIEKEIRPRLQADGGDIELIDIDGNKVTVAMRAMCVGCPMGGVTMSNIQEKLKELVDENIVVETE